VTYDTLGDVFESAATGDADAIVFDRPMLQYLLIQNPEIDLEIAPSGYQPQNYGFAAADEELAHTISLAILAVQETGELDRIAEDWLGSID
jgi:ABC-type amino acid transport substrate-binding protein